MRPNESFVGQPIRSLQQMLRVIAENDERQPSVVPDGIYGNDTVRAVSALQRSAGLPVTGIADQDTWDATVARYQIALIEQLEAEPLRIILDPGQVIRQGESNPNLYIIQAILLVLSQQYPGITQPGMSGVLDLATADSISSFQQINLIPVTGELDKHTWKALALHYPMAANALQQPK
jgi:peptidoglycan hydrolase-like protein with peptidoglycan-binding domain